MAQLPHFANLFGLVTVKYSWYASICWGRAPLNALTFLEVIGLATAVEHRILSLHTTKQPREGSACFPWRIHKNYEAGARIAVAEEIDKYEDDIEKLIDTGKEKGYLTFGEVNDLLPDDMNSPDELDDLITTIGTQGIDLLDGPEFRGEKEFEPEEGEDVELDLTPGTLEKTNDPVRMYLREMGTVPLLTREGEVEIAKRIERGQLRVMKALSRSPIVIREIVALGEDLKRGVRNVKEVVVFDEEELTEDVVQARVKATVTRIEALVKHQKKIAQLEEKLAAPPAGAKAKSAKRASIRWLIAREKVLISRIVRELKYTPLERKRLLDKVNKTVDTMRTLERQIRSLDQKFEASKSEELQEGVPPPAEELQDRPGKDRGRRGRLHCRAEAHPARDDPGRYGRRAGQAGAD